MKKTKQNKQSLIDDILSRNIYHNIRIMSSKLPEYEDGEIDIFLIAGDMLDNFKNDFEDYVWTPQNDCGNRNLGKDCGIKGEVWSAGRMGATLYWDAYYNEYGKVKFEDYELEEKSVGELKAIIKDLNFFDKSVKGLMKSFYEECEYQLKEYCDNIKREKEEAEQYEKDIATAKALAKKHGFILAKKV